MRHFSKLYAFDSYGDSVFTGTMNEEPSADDLRDTDIAKLKEWAVGLKHARIEESKFTASLFVDDRIFLRFIRHMQSGGPVHQG